MTQQYTQQNQSSLASTKMQQTITTADILKTDQYKVGDLLPSKYHCFLHYDNQTDGVYCHAAGWSFQIDNEGYILQKEQGGIFNVNNLDHSIYYRAVVLDNNVAYAFCKCQQYSAIFQLNQLRTDIVIKFDDYTTLSLFGYQNEIFAVRPMYTSSDCSKIYKLQGNQLVESDILNTQLQVKSVYCYQDILNVEVYADIHLYQFVPYQGISNKIVFNQFGAKCYFVQNLAINLKERHIIDLNTYRQYISAIPDDIMLAGICFSEAGYVLYPNLYQQLPIMPVFLPERYSILYPQQLQNKKIAKQREYDEEFGEIRANFAPDGSAYKGTWRGDQRHGRGVQVCVNGDVYKGEFKSNLYDGYGQFYRRIVPLKSKLKVIPQFPEEDPELQLVYDGHYREGYREGFGRFFYSHDSMYVGYFERNLRSGYGCLYYAPTVDRQTILKAVQTESQTYIHVNKHAVEQTRETIPRLARPYDYENQFQFESKVTMTHARKPYGAIYMGSFFQDARQGLGGTVIYDNGDVFTGKFEANAAVDAGVTYYVEKHNKFEGVYSAGEQKAGIFRQEWSADDYAIIFDAWSHFCGGYPGLPEQVFLILQNYQNRPETETVNRNFYNDVHYYPYCFRPQLDQTQLQEFISSVQNVTDPVEFARRLPIRMAPAPEKVQNLLHLPLEDHGELISQNHLVDSMQIITQQMQAYK